MNKPILSTISLCRRAGKLLMGFDVTAQAVQKGTVRHVFVCRDVAENSRKAISRRCGNCGVTVLELPAEMDEIEYYVGKRAGILAVTDLGLEAKIVSQLGSCKEDTVE